MLRVALFIITLNWKQHEGPAMGKWFNKMRHILAVDYSLAIKKNEILKPTKIWVDFKGIILGEIKANLKMFTCLKNDSTFTLLSK